MNMLFASLRGKEHKATEVSKSRSDKDRERETERERETDMRRITYPLFINSLAREET